MVDMVKGQSWLAEFKNAGGLPFQAGDDALNFASESAQHGRRWARERGFSLLQDYLNDGLNVVLKISRNDSVFADPKKSELVTQVIPSEHPDLNFANAVAANLLDNEGQAFFGGAKTYDRPVLIRIRKSGELVEQIITARIRLQSFCEVAERGIDAPANTFYLSVYFGGGLTEREVDALGVRPPKQDGSITKSVIEGVAKVVDDTACDMPNSGGHALLEAEFIKLVASIRICIADDSIAAGFDEPAARHFKVVNSFFSALD